MSNGRADAAYQRLLDLVDDPEFGSYPDRTHLIAADNPHHDEMATKALLDGDPVALVFADGHELLIRPESSGGARLEARGCSGRPVAA